MDAAGAEVVDERDRQGGILLAGQELLVPPESTDVDSLLPYAGTAMSSLALAT